MRILLIDNYDSFVYNIVELLRQLDYKDLTVRRNDEISIEEAKRFTHIIISPGPATPKESGKILEIIRILAPTHKILGICLGHQAIAEVFGAKLIQLSHPQHGFQSEIVEVNDNILFHGLSINGQQPLRIGLYHSWLVGSIAFPACLEVTSMNREAQIMSIRHRNYQVTGIQFHPESFMTPKGAVLLKNWMGVI